MRVVLHMNIVCIGDCGIDRYLDSKTESLGGCSLNVAMNLVLPTDGSISASVVTVLSANDDRSKEISELLTSRRITLCASLLPGNLPVQNIFLEKSGERIFKGYETGILSAWKLSKIQTELIVTADVVITLAFTQILPLFIEILDSPRQGKLCIDFMDMTDFEKNFSRIELYLEQCDIAFFGLSKSSDQKLIADIKCWYEAASPEKIGVLTFGPEGSLAVGSGFLFEQPAECVTTVVDTTGAGDSFAAVFISTYLTGGSVPEALKAAGVRAASVVQMKGSF
jgi:fructoselysine 6-kinase